MLDMTPVEVRDAQQQFVEMLTDIQKIASRAFDHLDPEAREEAVANAVALSWANHLHCVAEDKRVGAPSLAHYAIQGVKSGRSLCGQSSVDVLAARTRILGRATVQSLSEAPVQHPADDGDDESHSGWWNCSEALVDRKVWERPRERVRIKLDYDSFLRWPRVTVQECEVFNLLARGHRTSEIAHRLEVSAPRVCQIKNSIGEKLVGFFGRGVRPA